MMLPNVLSKEGYSKITETCRLALAEDLNYVWIDTCCIDKTSSAELTETINSMFELYKKVAVCYVYLQDLDPQTYLKNGLKSCRWITRGWTLQELLASEKVHFYDRTWRCRGSKVDWAHDISIATGIHHDALLGRPLQAFSIAQRMSWASDRETTRAKDLAYYLLGIFEVHMPLIYGEGKHAFRRLQEEIVKRTNELTIFAWNQSKDCMNCTDPEPDHDGLFAPSPSNFYTSHDIIRSSHFESEFTLTNRGLKLKHHIFGFSDTEVSSLARYGRYQTFDYFLWLGQIESPDSETCCVGVYLNKVGPDTFIRRLGTSCINLPAIIFKFPEYGSSSTRPTIYIIVDPERSKPDSRIESLQFIARTNRDVILSLYDRFWDRNENLFFEPPTCSYVFAVSLKYRVHHTWINITALCDYEPEVPTLRIFDTDSFPDLYNWLLQRFHKKDCPRWWEVLAGEPEAERFTNKLEIIVSGRRLQVHAAVTSGPLADSSPGIMYRASLSFRHLPLGTGTGHDDSHGTSDSYSKTSDYSSCASSDSDSDTNSESNLDSDSDGGCLLTQ